MNVLNYSIMSMALESAIILVGLCTTMCIQMGSRKQNRFSIKNLKEILFSLSKALIVLSLIIGLIEVVSVYFWGRYQFLIGISAYIVGVVVGRKIFFNYNESLIEKVEQVRSVL